MFRILPVGWLHRIFLRRALPADGRSPDLLRAYTGWMDKEPGRLWFRHFYASYTNRVDPELTAELNHIQCPTAVIWGDKDPWCPMDIAHELVETIDTAVLTPCPGAGHFVMEAAAPAVLSALEAVLKRELPNEG